jgi:hypothetical protein
MTLCPAGCSLCSSATICTGCLTGYAMESTSCIRCKASCRTCSPTSTSECLSCPPGQNLYSG